ncbi:MAG: T9SS type A sorting domain-containing protein, partial [Chitinophagaceae bacterium]
PVRKRGNDAFTFPVGKSGAGYHYCGISAPGSTTDAFEAEYMRASAVGLGSVTASGLDHVSNCEYWKLDRKTGSSNINVTLSWNGTSNCSAAAYINDLATLVVAHFGTSWDAFGNDGGTSGSATDGSVTWNNVSIFSPFSLGSTASSKNPLPVKFVNVRAYTAGEKNRIEWTNMTESEVDHYEVERSTDGNSFTLLSSMAARSNNAGKEEYTVLDNNTTAAVIWYRIRAKEFDGTFVYSPIVKVSRHQSDNVKLVLYPNPVVSGQLTIQLYSNRNENYTITVYSNAGQQVLRTSWQHSGGSASRSVELPASLAPGYYHLQVSGGGKTFSEKFVRQ